MYNKLLLMTSKRVDIIVSSRSNTRGLGVQPHVGEAYLPWGNKNGSSGSKMWERSYFSCCVENLVTSLASNDSNGFLMT